MFRFSLIIFTFFVALTPTSGQEVYNDDDSKFITKIGFSQLTGGVILIKATFNDIPDSLNFILDTGSGAISLDSSTTEEFNIDNYPSGFTVSGIAGKKPVNFSRNNTLHFPGLKIDSLDFFINDYNVLSSVYGVKIDGVIGYSFLSRYIVAIDYDDRTISVFTNGRYKYPRGSHILKPAFTSLPILKTMARDERKVRSNFYLDTGAGLSFLVTDNFINDSSFLRKKRKLIPMIVHGLGGKKGLRVTIIRQVQIGPHVFKNVPTNILEDEHNALSYPLVSGLIGNDLMRRFNVVLNYNAKEIAIKPNTHYRDLFDYSYTGMNMYMNEAGEIVLDDILTGSPAHKAGLKDGDILLGVNKNFSNNITVYRDLLQHVGERVNLLISRNHEVKIIRIRIGRIY